MHFSRSANFKKIIGLLVSLLLIIALYKNYKSIRKSKRFMHVNTKLELSLKQLSRAFRFERDDLMRSKMSALVERLRKSINTHAVKNTELEKRWLENLSVFVDASTSITDVSALRIFLTQLIKQLETRADYSNSITVVLLLARNVCDDTNEALLRKVRTLIHDLKVKTLTEPLHFGVALSQVATKYVLVCVSACLFSVDDLPKILSRLESGESDVVGVTHLNARDEWRIGCFQSKLMWYQYNLQAGYDCIINSEFVQCDHLGGPFVTTKLNIISSLYAKDRGRPQSFLENHFGDEYALHSNFLFPHLSSLHLFYEILSKKKTVHVCLNCSPIRLYGGDTGREMHWVDFAKKTKISDFIYTPDGTARGKSSSIRFSCQQINSPCHQRRKAFFSERCCIQSLHDMLITTFQLFDKHKLEYVLSDGSALGAIKIKLTLPWDLDHDYEFRSENFTALMEHKEEFSRHGLRLVPELEPGCIENATERFTCGYVGIRNQYWRLESWGQRLLSSDFYQRWKIPKENIKTVPVSRIQGNPTKVRMGDYWTNNQPNPGRFVRGRFGTNCLKHVRHRLQGGPKDFVVTSKLHFGVKCPLGDFHGCIDTFLGDGNLIFEKTWA